VVAVTGLFSGFAVDDIDAARTFYADVLGLTVKDNAMGNLALELPQGGAVLIYPRPDHVPATYTMLNLQVADIDIAVDELAGKGVVFERYLQMSYQDEKGIARGRSVNRGPDIAWFTDPAGNIVSVLST
jgi:catechol 2,3-dioxygenase-like lactoylglutathione lyase family enzyme